MDFIITRLSRPIITDFKISLKWKHIITNYLIIGRYESAYSYILNSITIDPVSPGSTGTYTMNSSWSVSTTVSIPALTQLDGSDLPSWTVYNSSTDVMTWTAPTNNVLTQLLLQYWVTDTTYTSLTGKFYYIKGFYYEFLSVLRFAYFILINSIKIKSSANINYYRFSKYIYSFKF